MLELLIVLLLVLVLFTLLVSGLWWTRRRRQIRARTPLPEVLLRVSSAPPRPPRSHMDIGRLFLSAAGGFGGAAAVALITRFTAAGRGRAIGAVSVFETSQKPRERVLAQLATFPDIARRTEVNAGLWTGMRSASVQEATRPERLMEWVPEAGRHVSATDKLVRGTERACINPRDALAHSYLPSTILDLHPTGGTFAIGNYLTDEFAGLYPNAHVFTCLVRPARLQLRGAQFVDGFEGLLGLGRVFHATFMDESVAGAQAPLTAISTFMAGIYANAEEEDPENILPSLARQRGDIVVPSLYQKLLPVKPACTSPTTLLTWRETVLDAIQFGVPAVLGEQAKLARYPTSHDHSQRVLVIATPLEAESFARIREHATRMLTASGLIDRGTSVYWARIGFTAAEQEWAPLTMVCLEAVASVEAVLQSLRQER